MSWALAIDLSPLRRLRLLPLVCSGLLIAIGVCFVFSANSYREHASLRMLYLDHAEMGLAGLVLMVVVGWLDYRRLLSLGWVFYGLVLALLVVVLAIGEERMGARRWVFGIQPSELAKLATIMVLAWFLGRPGASRSVRDYVCVLAIAGLPMVLILLQPDLGTAMVFVPTVLAMVFASGTAPRTLLATVLTGLLAVVLVLGAVRVHDTPATPPPLKAAAEKVTGLFNPYQLNRLRVFLYPELDPHGMGYNKRQSEIAIGSGGLWGKGFRKGDQNLLGYLPAQVSANDFIFSVLAEEKGYVGSLAVLLLYAGIVFPGLWVAGACREGSGRLLAVGVVTLLFCHVFINIAMTVGIMPVTGLPLPFISYGRTFMLTMTVALGLLQSVAVHGRTAGAAF